MQTRELGAAQEKQKESRVRYFGAVGVGRGLVWPGCCGHEAWSQASQAFCGV